VTSPVTGNVPATLSLELGSTVNLGTFVPGVGRAYETTIPATVTTTAGDATLTVADPDAHAPGRLVNGSFSLRQPVEVRAGGSAFAPLGATPLTLLSYAAPAANDVVTLGFRQSIAADEPLRTGTYSKTLTFTLSTTTP
jgi:hypothetical protein